MTSTSHLLLGVTDAAGRIVAPPQSFPVPRPEGPWDGNHPPVIGDRVEHGAVHAIASFPSGGHRIFVLDDDGVITETSLVEFARKVRHGL